MRHESATARLAARHPDTGPQAVQLPAIAYVPAQQDDPGYQRAA
jgi:hypothetical protein